MHDGDNGIVTLLTRIVLPSQAPSLAMVACLLVADRVATGLNDDTILPLQSSRMNL